MLDLPGDGIAPRATCIAKRNLAAARLAIRWRSIKPTTALAALPDYARALASMARHRTPPSPRQVQIACGGLDIVTVVFRAELDLLALQARSFDRFLAPDFGGRIFILVNDLRWRRVVARLEADVLPQYGRWRDRVTIVPFHDLAYRLDPANGWILQQALKLACARLVGHRHYVVFDAKNHLVAPTHLSRFVDADGLAIHAIHDPATHLPRHHETCARYFAIELDESLRQFVPMTPFVLHTQSVRDMIDHIEAREGHSLSDFFCARRFVSEFLLYGSYLNAVKGGIGTLYRDAPCKVVTIWPAGPTAETAIADAQHNDAFCFGTHRDFIAGIDDAQMRALESFWRKAGLLGPGECLHGLGAGSRSAPAARGSGLASAATATMLGSLVAVVSAATLFHAQPLATVCALGAAAVGLVAAAVRLRGRLADLLLTAGSLAAVAALIAGIATALKQETRVEGESGLIVHGGPLGWTLRPGAHRVVKTINDRTIYDVVYDIDSQGHRVTRSATDGPAVAFLGDSFTFGEGIGDSQTLPQAFADLTGQKLRVVNLGVSAYSPAQVLREMQLGLYDDVLKPAKVFFMLTASWHTDRVACEDDWVVGAPRYVTVDGALVSDGQCPPLPEPGPLTGFLRQTAAYKLLFGGKLPFVSDSDIANYINVVAETVKVARGRYGVSLKLLYLRNAGYLRYTGYNDDDIILRLRAGGADVLEMTLPHEGKTGFAIVGDGHPDGIGNRLRAKMLVDALAGTDPGLLAP